MSADPSWTDVVAAVSLAVTAAVVFFSALFGIAQLLDSRRTRYGQLIGDLSRRWEEPGMMQTRNALVRYKAAGLLDLTRRVYEKRASPDERSEFLGLQRLPNYLEGIGILEGKKVKALPIDLVDELWGGAVLTIWRIWAPTVEFLRDQPGGKQNYANLERLEREIKHHRASGGQSGGKLQRLVAGLWWGKTHRGLG